MGLGLGLALGGSLLGGIMGDRGARRQSAANARALQLQREQFETTQENLQPFRELADPAIARLGQLSESVNINNPNTALPQLQQATSRDVIDPSNYRGLSSMVSNPAMPSADTLYQNFEASPGYQHRLESGRDIIEGGAAAAGNLFSGRTAKALDKYRQGVASEEFNNYANRDLARFDREMQASNTQYGRGVDQFNRDVTLNDLYFNRDNNANINQYNRDFAATDYNNQQALNLNNMQFSRDQSQVDANRGLLQGLLSVGQNAAAQQGNNASNYAGAAGRLHLNQGNIDANRYGMYGSLLGNIANTAGASYSLGGGNFGQGFNMLLGGS